MNTRKSNKRTLLELKTNDTQDEKKSKQIKLVNSDDDNSSDSSVGNYLKNADEIDLNSSFFQLEKPENSFNDIEKQIFSGIQRLNDSESSENEATETIESTNHKLNFQQLYDYNKKIEDTKTCVKKYENKLQHNSDENKLDILQLLSMGETKLESKLEYYESESEIDEMDWEEVDEKEQIEEKRIIPKNVEITVALPTTMRQKKKVDLMAAIKRRINRVKKENQVLIHKVHLLCWIAHGNYINSVLNDENLLGLSLSLLPSENCYPPKHADLNYMEMIAKWYGKIMKISDDAQNTDTIKLLSLNKSLKPQIEKKLAKSKRDFVLIFICILRSLGLQCRLVLSLQVMPLRPPSSELCSLSTKDTKSNDKNTKKSEPVPSTSKEEKVNPTPKLVKDVVKNRKNTPKSETKQILKSKEINSSDTNTKTPQKNVDSTSEIKVQQTSKNTRKKKFPSVVKSQEKLKNESQNTTKNAEKPTRNRKSKHLLENTEVNSRSSQRTTRKKSENSQNKDENTDISDPNQVKKPSKPKNISKINKDNNKTEPAISNTDSEQSTKDTQLKKSKPCPKSKKKSSKLSQLDGADDETPSTSKTKSKVNLGKLKNASNKKAPEICISKRHPRKVNIEGPKYLDAFNSDDDFQTHKNSNKKSNDIINIVKSRRAEEKHKHRQKLVKAVETDSDSDYAEEIVVPKQKTSKKKGSEDDFDLKANIKVKKRVKPIKEIDNKILSSDSEDIPNKKQGIDIWVEVFLEAEEKWISVDIIKGQIHCVSELYSRASHPVSYILAWNNNLSVKDVTARYCPNWNTVTRKLRVDSKWWCESLRPFEGKKMARDKEEDEDLARQQLDKPLPTTISEYKNHPLYALKRHLLKFEAIYPPNALTLGFVRNEAVYARECVHTLYSREIWVKHAKVVKLGETPYKIVKARPKYDKLTGNTITDIPLEIFGKWQVEEYVPPTAENGIVPRNAFGNVELFKACMLPKKTVHLQLPGLNKVAKKLQIDCAPAVVGFEFHAGGSHPTFDGYVVCEEFRDTLVAAWEQEQEDAVVREQEKYEKRVYGNWRRLIKAALIRERLKARYDFGGTENKAAATKKTSKGPRFLAKKRRVYSESESDSEAIF